MEYGHRNQKRRCVLHNAIGVPARAGSKDDLVYTEQQASQRREIKEREDIKK